MPALVLVAGPAHAAGPTCPDGPCVIVEVVGTTTATRTFSLEDLANNPDVIPSETYVLRTPRGQTSSPQVSDSVPIRSLISAVSLSGGGTVDPDAVTFAEVIDDQGISYPLTATDLGPSGSNGFQGGLMPAVFGNEAADVVQYVRPLRDDQDVNNTADPALKGWLPVQAPAALQIVAHTTGALLSPTIEASVTDLKVGQAATFHLAFDHDPDTDLTYAWDFYDGTTSTASAPTHAWTDSGTFYVNVTVRGSDGSYGRAQNVQVDVDPQPRSDPSVPPGGTGRDPSKHAPAAGPTKSKGHHAGGASGATAGGGGGAGQAGQAGSGGPEAGSTTRAPTTEGPGTATPQPGDQVEGIALVAAASHSAPLAIAAGEAPSAAAARATAQRHLGVPGWTAGGGALVALVGIGMLSETQAWRRPLRHRRNGTMTP